MPFSLQLAITYMSIILHKWVSATEIPISTKLSFWATVRRVLRIQQPLGGCCLLKVGISCLENAIYFWKFSSLKMFKNLVPLYDDVKFNDDSAYFRFVLVTIFLLLSYISYQVFAFLSLMGCEI